MRPWLVALLLPLAACSSDGGAGEWWQHPPDGTRWVGYDGAVVAVPDWWTTGDAVCGAPSEDTVYFDTGAIYDCSDPDAGSAVDEVSSLAILRDDGRYGPEDLDGGCEEWFEGVCRRLFAVPGSRAIFAVTIDDEGDADFADIRDSARILPDGVTTVPLAVAAGWTPSWGDDPRTVRDLTAAIERAGLEVDVEPVDPDPDGDVADLPPGSLLDAEPALGTPVAGGSTVVLKVMGGGTSGP